MMMRLAVWALMLAVAMPGVGFAGEVAVTAVSIRANGDGTYRFDVTLRHADTGWSHYADGWSVLAADRETMLATRTLYHPHVEEQPFTRSLPQVRIPAGMAAVYVRGHDLVHGNGPVSGPYRVPE